MSWNVHIGINPLSWMNDDLPSLGGDTPLGTMLAQGKEIGYEGFELGNKFPKDGPGLAAMLGAYGLSCVSGWHSGFLAEQSLAEEIERAEPHLCKLRHAGAKVVVYGECAGTVQGQRDTPVGRRPRFADDAAWRAYAQRLDAFGAHLLERFSLKLAYHHHMGAYVESPQDVDRLMSLTDPRCVGLLLDTGHAYFGGAKNPVDLLNQHAARVVHVHCKDVRPQVIAAARNEGWSFLTGVLNGTFTVPGDGTLDFEAVLHRLHEAGYEGWLVVEAEQDPAVAPSRVFAEKGFRTLRGIVDRIDAVQGGAR